LSLKTEELTIPVTIGSINDNGSNRETNNRRSKSSNILNFSHLRDKNNLFKDDKNALKILVKLVTEKRSIVFQKNRHSSIYRNSHANASENYDFSTILNTATKIKEEKPDAIESSLQSF
jgi:hypothetical protein